MDNFITFLYCYVQAPYSKIHSALFILCEIRLFCQDAPAFVRIYYWNDRKLDLACIRGMLSAVVFRSSLYSEIEEMMTGSDTIIRSFSIENICSISKASSRHSECGPGCGFQGGQGLSTPCPFCRIKNLLLRLLLLLFRLRLLLYRAAYTSNVFNLWRRIFVYPLGLINTWPSLSDEANKIKPLSIRRT